MRIYIARTLRCFLEFSHFVDNLLIDLSRLHIVQFICVNVICVTLFTHDGRVCMCKDFTKGCRVYLGTTMFSRDQIKCRPRFRQIYGIWLALVTLMSFQAIFDSTRTWILRIFQSIYIWKRILCRCTAIIVKYFKLIKCYINMSLKFFNYSCTMYTWHYELRWREVTERFTSNL